MPYVDASVLVYPVTAPPLAALMLIGGLAGAAAGRLRDSAAAP